MSSMSPSNWISMFEHEKCFVVLPSPRFAFTQLRPGCRRVVSAASSVSLLEIFSE